MARCDTVVSLPVLLPNPQSAIRNPQLLQPITDVPAYLEQRRPVTHYQAAVDEHRLFISLPDVVRQEVDALLAAFDHVHSVAGPRVKHRLSVQAGCKEALSIFHRAASRHGWTPKRFRARYDAWLKTGDWVSAVNRSKAGSAWQDRDTTVPDDFITFLCARIGSYTRHDAKNEAIRSIKRQWQTGRDKSGERKPIPGYGTIPVRLGDKVLHAGYWQDWFKSEGYKALGLPRSPLPEEAPEPPGWHPSNLLRLIDRRNAMDAAVQALLLEGTSAATAFLPQVHTSRALKRFLEEVQFDDVKTDFVIRDPRTGEVMDLWLLIAHDLATGVLLGFGMRPARTREDGTQEHLKLRDMKQLTGWILERFGLPPYAMVWTLEQGTAALSPGMRRALEEMLGKHRIKFHVTSMHGGKSPAGYFERSKGNSRGKASLESHNRLMHIFAADLPGQTGPHYAVRPQDLPARIRECKEIFQLSQLLPENLRGQMGYSLLSLQQAREQLFRIFGLRNNRTWHHMEGFAEIVEWYDETTGKWMPQNTFPADRPNVKTRSYRESPVMRAQRLVEPYKHQWTAVGPDIIAAYYEHTATAVRITSKGQIEIKMDGHPVRFINPTGQRLSLPSGANLLGYFHPDDPAYLHVTDGKGSVLGTWLRYANASDQQSLQTAIHYSATFMKEARDRASLLAAPRREELDAMRAANAQLLASNTFVEVGAPALQPQASRLQSPVAAGLASIPRARAKAQATTAHYANLASELDEA